MSRAKIGLWSDSHNFPSLPLMKSERVGQAIVLAYITAEKFLITQKISDYRTKLSIYIPITAFILNISMLSGFLQGVARETADFVQSGKKRGYALNRLQSYQSSGEVRKKLSCLTRISSLTKIAKNYCNNWLKVKRVQILLRDLT